MFSIYKKRIEKLKEKLVAKNITSCVILDPSHIFYFAGTDAPQALIVNMEEEPVLLSNRLESYRTEEEKKIGVVYVYSRTSEDLPEHENVIIGDLFQSIGKILKEKLKGQSKVGLAGKNLSYESYLKLSNIIGNGVEGMDDDVMRMRMLKEDYEINLIEKTVTITEEVLGKAIESLDVGVTENEVVGFIQKEFRKRGALDAFLPIVAFGPHSSHPHAVPGFRRLKKGDIVKIDMGARFQGYCADITRTFVFGKASEKQKRLISIILEAQRAAIDEVSISVKASRLDLKARNVLRKYDLAKYFIHSLGHGVGIEVHEPPYLSSFSNDLIERRMVFTIEPGVYIKDYGGVRIEDMILVNDEPKLLTSFEKFLEKD